MSLTPTNRSPAAARPFRAAGLASLLVMGPCLLPAAAAGDVPGQGPRQRLALGMPVEGRLDGELDLYAVHCTTGEFLQVSVDQRAADLHVRMRSPHGGQSVEADSPHGREALSFVAQGTGDCSVEVRGTGGTPPASYRILLEQQRPAQPGDQVRLAAQAAFAEGKRLRAESKPGWQERAVASLEAALAGWRQASEALHEVMALYELGLIASEASSDHAQAAALFAQALPRARSLEDRRWEALLLKSKGETSYAAGDAREGLELMGQAASLFEALGDARAQAETTISIGSAHEFLGDKQRALEHYRSALPPLRAAGDRANEATALNNIGATLETLGETQKALEAYDQALALRKSIGDQAKVVQTLNNIAVVYVSLGEIASAVERFEEGLRVLRELGLRRDQGPLLNNIAYCHTQLKHREQALDYYRQALAFYREVGERAGEGNSLDQLGSLHHSLGDYPRALEHLQAALEIRQSQENRGNVAVTQHRLGRVYASLGQSGKNLELQGQALATSRQIGLRWLEAAALYETARETLRSGDLTAARAAIEAALDVVESLRSRTPGRPLRASYLASVHSYYDLHVDVLLALHERTPSEGWSARALEASEWGRARGLLDALAEARVDVRAGADPALLERERALQGQLRTAGERQVQLLSGRHTDRDATTLERELQALALEYGQVQAGLRRASPRYADLAHPRPLSSAEIQRLLDEETVLLEFSLGEDRSHVWAVTSGGLRAWRLPPESEIEAAAVRAYEALSRRPPGAGPEGRPTAPPELAALSQMILGPVAETLQARRLVIVADGALQYIPFAALPPPSSTDRAVPGRAVLASHHEIVNLPSASALAALRREAAGRPAPGKVAVALADPVFDARDSRVHGGRAVAPLAAGVERALGEAGLLGRDGRIPRLPYTRREVSALSALAPGAVTTALDFDASRERALGPDVAGHRIVHIATHGVLNNEHPELSGVVLSLVDRGGRAIDGFLPLHEVYDLRLPVDLVVLSACQTALGKPVRGEGLVGLTRGFLYAGATRVVASLWKADEVATARLMERFYQGVLRQRLRPAAALRAAQLALAREARFQEPYYWAGFVLQGDWN